MVTGARGIRCLVLFRRDHLPPRGDDLKADALQLFSGTSLPSFHICTPVILPGNPGAVAAAAAALSSGEPVMN